MPTIRLETKIEAPLELCFDLARDIDLHLATVAHTSERAVAGVTSGLIGDGGTVTFEGVHFGIRQRLTVQITEFERPYHFVDEMTVGPFQAMRHAHDFAADGEGTLMVDTFEYTSPLGPLGVLADKLFLERYMRGLLQGRMQQLKRIAETRAGHSRIDS